MRGLWNLEECVKNEYLTRFNEDEQQIFIKAQISPNIVIKYNSRFNSNDILFLIKSKCPSEQANEYNCVFNAQEIVELINVKCSAEETAQYHAMFNGIDITNLYKARITNKQALEYCLVVEGFWHDMEHRPECYVKTDKYSKCFDGEEIVALIKKKESPKNAREFLEQFHGKNIKPILISRIPLNKAKKYSNKFEGDEIVELFENECGAKIANNYSKIFLNSEIVKLAQYKISPKKANSYAKLFLADEIKLFLEKKYELNKINEYDERFNGKEIALMIQEQIPAVKANQYNSRFTGHQITDLYKKNLFAEKVNEFNEKYTSSDIIKIIEMNLDSKEIAKYPFLPIEEIIKLIAYDISPEKEHQLWKFLNVNEMISIYSEITPDKEKYIIQILDSNIDKYYKRQILLNINHATQFFALNDLKELINFVEPKNLFQYHQRFKTDELILLNAIGCSPDEANNYSSEINGFGAAVLFRAGIRPKDINLKKQIEFNEILHKISSNEDIKKNPEDYGFIATGSSSIVLVEKKTKKAYKFSKRYRKEYELLKKIEKIQFKNILAVENISEKDSSIQLKYVTGKSMEEIIRTEKINSDKVLKYSSEIINGLCEMRRAGIYYHRDLRPANIMIDDQTDRVLIIDFEFGLETKIYEYIQGNKRFKGANDLVSLGQMMYFMATGNHIFTESNFMNLSVENNINESINDERTRVYNDHTGESLKQYLAKIDKIIENEKVALLIKECLTAKNYDYGRINKLFQKYIN